MLFSALLASTVLSQSVLTVYENSDCTGEQQLVINAASQCNANNNLCIGGLKKSCSSSPPSEAIKVPNPSLKYVLEFDYGAPGCSSNLLIQASMISDGVCHKAANGYFQTSCNGTSATVKSCYDKDCTDCKTSDVSIGSCVADPVKQSVSHKYVCVEPNTAAKSSAAVNGIAAALIASMIVLNL